MICFSSSMDLHMTTGYVLQMVMKNVRKLFNDAPRYKMMKRLIMKKNEKLQEISNRFILGF